jgi:hypothetical protein
MMRIARSQLAAGGKCGQRPIQRQVTKDCRVLTTAVGLTLAGQIYKRHFEQGTDCQQRIGLSANHRIKLSPDHRAKCPLGFFNVGSRAVSLSSC